MKHPPVAIGLVLCELVIVDEKTHGVTPVNCFNFRVVEEFPAEVSFYVLAWLADGEGEMLAEVVVENLEALDEVYRADRKLGFAGVLQESRFVARIRSCIFPTAGYYQVSLTVGGELIAQRKLLVQRKDGTK